jgi:molybdate transport system permease protein
MRRASSAPARGVAVLGAVVLVGLLVLPLVALLLTSSPGELWAELRTPALRDALVLSLATTSLALAVVVLAGTPLSWWLARSHRRSARVIERLVDIPIVVPPAVIGVALLLAFGRHGLFAPWSAVSGWALPFTTAAVVVAQIVVSAPFFVRSAAAAFRGVDDDLIIVARTLGASPARAFALVAVPSVLPGLLTGAGLSWARALGEFGATLLFAGNLPGRTQTMPLAIYAALERDLGAARAASIVLAVAALGVMALVHVAARIVRDRGGSPPEAER